MLKRLLAGLGLMLVAAGATAAPTPDEAQIAAGRALLFAEHPEAFAQMARNDGFGGPASRLIANRMQDRAPELVAEARAKMTIVISHTHVDHAYGAYALLADKPQIITTAQFQVMADVDSRLRGDRSPGARRPARPAAAGDAVGRLGAVRCAR